MSLPVGQHLKNSSNIVDLKNPQAVGDRAGVAGDNGVGEPESRGLGQTARDARNPTHLTGETYFAHGDGAGGQGAVEEAAGECNGHGEIGRDAIVGDLANPRLGRPITPMSLTADTFSEDD